MKYIKTSTLLQVQTICGPKETVIGSGLWATCESELPPSETTWTKGLLVTEHTYSIHPRAELLNCEIKIQESFDRSDSITAKAEALLSRIESRRTLSAQIF